MPAVQQTVEDVRALEADKYKHGFVTDIEQDFAPKGLDESTVRFISGKKDEPEWMLQWRLEAFERWLTLEEPDWALLSYPPINYQDAYYYAAPRIKPKVASLDEIDPEILETYKKLGIPLREQEVLLGVEGAPRVAVDAVFDSVSVVTTFKEELAKAGVIFCSISEAMREHPDLVKALARLSRRVTTILRRSTAPCSRTDLSSTSRRAFAAPWNCRRISA
jgi:Fe-S cluster assembly protein SufB